MIGVNRRRVMGGGTHPTIIMDSSTNPEVLAVCYAQGWCASQNYMTLEEARAVTDIGTIFRNNTQITHFEEFKYFGVTSLSSWCFSGMTNLLSIEVPDTITAIPNYAFANTKKLIEFHYKPAITSVGSYVFSHTVQSPITIIYDGAKNEVGKLNNCPGVKYASNVYAVSDGVLYDPTDMSVIAVEPSKTSPVFPNGITSFLSYSCSYWLGSSISIPNTVLSLGSYCFTSAKSLASITLPDNIALGSYCFSGCTALTAVTIPSGCIFGSYVFIGCSNLDIVKWNCSTLYQWDRSRIDCNEYTSDVFDVYDKCLYDGTTLYKVPTKHTSISFKEGTTRIGAYAMQKNQITGTLVIPEGITRIDTMGLNTISGITTLDLPSTLTYIDNHGCSSCSNVRTLIIRRMTAPSLNTYAFYSWRTSTASDPCVLKVPTGATGYSGGYWNTYLFNKGWTIEYI